MRYFLVMLLCALGGCVRIPKGIQPVTHFDVHAFLGRWYEIARLDHGFERGLSHGTAEYRLRDDGGIDVINRGFDAASGKWKTAKGKAYLVGDQHTGHLKVSFFGPFYGSYIIFDLDKEGQYALVTGSSRSYLWLLARTPTIDKALKEQLLQTMKQLGFATKNLIFVSQDIPLTHSKPGTD